MINRKRDKQNSGFTVVEMLAVVAILVILLGISMVSVVRYRDLLKLTELDNAAREIYMAAENRAVLLSGAKRLNSQVQGAGKQAVLSGGRSVCCVSKGELKTPELLTSGSIDPALMDGAGDFYIVYEQKEGVWSVTDVFYSEQTMDIGGSFAAFYSKWAVSRSDRLKLKDDMLIGWYNGEAAEGVSIEPDDPPKEPFVEVIIENGEMLTVTVKYSAPGPANLSVRLG